MQKSKVFVGDVIDVLRTLPENTFHTCVTSPPYFGLRDYGIDGQIGLEPTPEHFVATMVDVFREVRRVLRNDGTVWLNLGDSYAACGQRSAGFKEPRETWTTNSKQHPQGRAPSNGVKPKNLIGIPWRVAFALQQDGWYLRSDIIWHKPNPMPESVKDRPTRAHEYLFLLAKSAKYFYDMESVKEPAKYGARGSTFTGGKTGVAMGSRCSHKDRVDRETRNPRTVWTITPKPFKGAHFAVFPPALVEPCIKAGTSEAGCCPYCLAPRVRIVDRKRVATRPGEDTKTAGLTTEQFGNRDPQRHVTLTSSLGFKPSCKCGEERSIPCNVLDPFCGSGTTGIVAKQLGRSFVGIELNPEYAAMAEKRIAS